MKSRNEFTNDEIGQRAWLEYIRHYYAGQAMQGFIASYAGAENDPAATNVAAKSVEYADALIKQLTN